MTYRLLLLLPLAACSSLSDPVRVAGNVRDVLDVPPEPMNKIDLLFVVDNSQSTQDDQEQLAAGAREALFDVLAQGPDGVLPDLHIAVISSDMGDGGFGGCPGPIDGDDGAFLLPLPGFCDSSPRDAYLIDEAGPDGTRVSNFDGTLGDTFACMIQVTRGRGPGCGFEQPFAAIERALDGRHPAHAGFLREDALLAVIILTDEDDCTASDPTLFDPSNLAVGPFGSYRCFAQGVTCASGQTDPTQPGERSDCTANEASEYIQPVQQTVDFLQGVKSDPTKVMLVTVAGPDRPVVALPNENAAGELYLGPSCAGGPDPAPGASASPAIRVDALVDALPARSSQANICADVVEGLGKNAAALVSVTTRQGCLTRAPRDTDVTTPGLQADCRAFDVSKPLTEAERRTEIHSCADNLGREPCFEIVEDAACSASGTGLSASVRRANPALGQHLIVSCLLD